jgi:hypothetical protein
VLASHDRREFVEVLLEQLAKLEEHARTPQRRRIRPLSEGGGGRGDRFAGDLCAGQRHPRRDLSAGRIEDLAPARITARDPMTIDEVLQLSRICHS